MNRLGSVNFDKFLATAMSVSTDEDFYFSLPSSIVFIIIIVVFIIIFGLCLIVACVVGLCHVTCIAGALFLACAACVRCLTNSNANVSTVPPSPAQQYSSVIVHAGPNTLAPVSPHPTSDVYGAVPTYSVECIELGDLTAKNERCLHIYITYNACTYIFTHSPTYTHCMLSAEFAATLT